ncbi:MAG: 50S ribosomal protein L16 [Minisyncoccales bacterium]
MAFQPANLKYKKAQRRASVLKRKETRAIKLAFGQWGLVALEAKWLNSKHLESIKKIIVHHLKKGGKIHFRIFPNQPITQKALGTRMGGGKGDVVDYIFPVKKGRILVEIEGAKDEEAEKALSQAQYKLPIKTKIIKK